MLKIFLSMIFALYGFIVVLSGFGHLTKGNILIGILSFVFGLALMPYPFYEAKLGFIKSLIIKIIIVLFILYGFDAIYPSILKEYWANGSIHYERTYQGGKQNGITKEYDKDGTLLSEINFKNHKQDGITKVYFKNGIIKLEALWQKGEELWWKEYDESGNLINRSEK